ncbi:ribosomal protein S5 domain 2-type protein [Limtongia smithiae]|uniref:ribosomal protein S5 domain 2-type protein n=1 Tax=Limtongia smithiae TaxID=1125753 RepID=UPI0034CF217D
MPRNISTTVIENEFVLKALTENVRLDNRAFMHMRPLDVQFSSTEYGVVDVRLGRTRVVARISAEVTQPRQDRPYDGLFIITTEISPMAAPTFEAGRKSEEELVISRIIDKSIRLSGALDTESLCIIAGEKCWAIRADVHFLDHDGGLVDAACIAVSAGLHHYRRPDVSIRGVGNRREIHVHPVTERVPVPLSVLHFPVCVTFSFFDKKDAVSAISESATNADDDMPTGDGDDDEDNTVVLIDASLQEEILRHGFMSVTANSNQEISQIYKAGELAVDVSLLLKFSELSIKIADRITALVKKRLVEDEEVRNVGNMRAEASAENDR